MSSCSRRTVLAALALAPLSACGFTPVYAPGGGGEILRRSFIVEPPTTRLGFALVSRIEARLGRVEAPAYVLTYDISTSTSGLAITGADDVTRINIDGVVRYQVNRIGTDEVVESGQVTTFVAYSQTGTPIATVAARRDAEDRLMITLADQMVSRLLSSAPSWT
ncbi:MAG: LPS assembly lipoprotein LptE [Pseudomonadota bacterium]